MRQINKTLALLLALLTFCSVLPVPAQATGNSAYALRSEVIRCGANLNWTVDNAGVLTISGSGAMENFFDETSAPWLSGYAGKIVKVVIENGVTTVGDYAFFGCSNLAQVELPDSLTAIGDYAFAGCVRLRQVEIPGSVSKIGEQALGFQINGKPYTGLTIMGEADSRAQAYAAAQSHITFRSVTAETALTSPRVSSVALGMDFAAVNWASAGSGVTYRVYYRKGSGSWVSAGDTKELTMNVSRLESGSKYTFAVVCLNHSGKPSYEPDAALGKTVTYLSAPELSGLVVISGGVQVKWKRVTGAAKYRVFYKLPGGKWKGAGDTTGTYLNVKKLSVGNTYTFTVRCITADARSYASGYDGKGMSIPVLETPKITSAVNVNGGVQLKWNRVTGAAKYRVFYRIGSGSWKGIADTTGTSLLAKGLSSNTTYRFTVRCLSSDGKMYTSAYDATGVVRAYYTVPELSGVYNDTNGVSVRWHQTAGVSKYRVFYRHSGGSWIAAGDTTGTALTVTGLTSGESYTFTVRGINSAATAYTTGYNATGRSITYIQAPKLIGASCENGVFTVHWKASSGAEKYRVFYKNSAGKWKKLGDTTGTSFRTKALNANTPQTFTVRCINASASAFTSGYDSRGVVAGAGGPLSYNFTSGYLNSQYYTNLMNVHLTGNPRDDIVAVAMSQLGYHEGKSGDTSGSGNGYDMDNYTEYGRWYYNHVDSGDVFYRGAWCSMFASWCANEAGISTNVIPRRALVAYMADSFGNMGRYYTWNQSACGYGSKTIQKGDLIIYSERPGSRLSHIGIVTGVVYNGERCTISTVEGNVNDQCRTRRWIMTKSSNGYIDGEHVIRGFCCPNY